MNYFLVGIKGTGMASLASYLSLGGDSVSGCDVEEDFYTSSLLGGFEILPLQASLPDGIDVLICSDAYSKRQVGAIDDATERGIPTYSYPEFLALLSKRMVTAGVSGTHGKTTVSSAAAYLLESSSFPGGAIYGSFLQGRTSGYHNGNGGLLVEACEYRAHFLLYGLKVLVITNISFDHPDFFKDLEAVRECFKKRVSSMPHGGVVIYHHSVKSVIKDALGKRSDLKAFEYGVGEYSFFPVGKRKVFRKSPDCHFLSEERSPEILADYMASAMAASALFLMGRGEEVNDYSLSKKMESLIPLLSSYPGVAARGEVVLDEGGVIYIDDYAHHPDEIKVALRSIESKFPRRRAVVLFMPHTASRTKAMMDEFSRSLMDADILFIERTYASARVDDDKEDPAKELALMLQKTIDRTFYSKLSLVSYLPDDDAAVASVSRCLLDGDICITMGAGDNRRLIKRISEERKNYEEHDWLRVCLRE